MTPLRSIENIGQYDDDGIVFPIRVFSPEEALIFRHLLESLSDDGSGIPLRRLDGLHLWFEWAYRLATHEAILDAVAKILGNDILIDGTLVFAKPPHDPGFVPWHQDSVYSSWHLTPSTSAWIALTASYPVNGCMRVIPGSHKQGLVEHDVLKDDANLLKRGERVHLDVDESKALDVVLKPGEASLHNCNIIHGSKPNTSDEPRIGFIIRYVTNQLRSSSRPLMRARGQSGCNHLEFAEPPIGIELVKAVASWRESTQLTPDGGMSQAFVLLQHCVAAASDKRLSELQDSRHNLAIVGFGMTRNPRARLRQSEVIARISVVSIAG